jgi:phosphate:Na+ symporter
LVKFSGVLILYGIFLLQPTSFIWQFSETTNSHSVALNIYLVVLAIQATGALLISLMSAKVLKFLIWYYPNEPLKTLYETKFIYPEAVVHPSTAILLASQEVDRLIEGLIDNLNPLRAKDGNHELIKQSDRHDACVSVSTKISTFIEQVALKNDTDEGIEKIFKLRAKNELVGLTQKSLNDFTLTLTPIIKNDLSITTSLVEGLHLILMLLTENVSEDEGDKMLLELTSEKSQLMENIRKSLVSDHTKSVSEKQSLLIATGIFERVLWLVRQITLSISDEKKQLPISSN